MAVRIRLRRIGKNPKKNPHFRVSVFNSAAGRDSRFVEEIGFYNPVTGAIKVDKERLEYWKGKGALVSQTIARLVDKAQ
ncbi:MAG: 30S ribosomal protein S16 [Candidatus Omnitrophota bacterium]|jgi:small subunit ribosomal protein S16